MSSSPPAVAVPQLRGNLARSSGFKPLSSLPGWLIYLAWQVAITRIPHGPPRSFPEPRAVAEAELIGTPLGGDRFQSARSSSVRRIWD